MKNIIVNKKAGGSLLFLCLILSPEEAKMLVETVLKEEVIDAYELKNEEVQYYCFDDRISILTSKMEENIRKEIKSERHDRANKN